MPEQELEEARDRMLRMGFQVQGATPEQIRQALQQRAEAFRDEAPMTAADAAKVILDGVREERWRILVGDDAHVIDRLVRESPEEAYEGSFMKRLIAEAGWAIGG